jgi:hypothetical protein
MGKIKFIAHYLPQFHPIPENDIWWGKGFTEWTNTAKAKPLFKGHYQPHVPADLGFYDLRLPQIREAQAEMAKEHGIYGFCYWHYWFGNGKRILELPFNEVLASKKTDFPFCLAWANQSWSGIWHGESDRVLVEQTYPGDDDYIAHFNYLKIAFNDKRYIRIDDKPLFFIYMPTEIPDLKHFTELFRDLAIKNGFAGIHFVVTNVVIEWDPKLYNIDAVSYSLMYKVMQLINSNDRKNKVLAFIKNPKSRYHDLNCIDYSEAIIHLLYKEKLDFYNYPSILPNWDNTPRSGKRGVIFHNSTPDLFEQHLKDAIEIVKDYPDEHKIIFVKSWNEWAEGNHLEPDLKWGLQYLLKIKKYSNI